MNWKIIENSEGTASNKHTKQQKRNTKKNQKPKFFYEMPNHKNSKRTVITKQTKQQKFKNKKPEIFNAMQYQIDYEGTAWNKENKQFLAMSTTYINNTYKLHIMNNYKRSWTTL